MANREDLLVTLGADFSRSLAFAGHDLSEGWHAQAVFRAFEDSPGALLVLVDGDGITLDSSGGIHLSMSAARTTGLLYALAGVSMAYGTLPGPVTPFQAPSGRLGVWALRLVGPDGSTFTQFSGLVCFSLDPASLTPPEDPMPVPTSFPNGIDLGAAGTVGRFKLVRQVSADPPSPRLGEMWYVDGVGFRVRTQAGIFTLGLVDGNGVAFPGFSGGVSAPVVLASTFGPAGVDDPASCDGTLKGRILSLNSEMGDEWWIKAHHDGNGDTYLWVNGPMVFNPVGGRHVGDILNGCIEIGDKTGIGYRPYVKAANQMGCSISIGIDSDSDGNLGNGAVIEARDVDKDLMRIRFGLNGERDVPYVRHEGALYYVFNIPKGVGSSDAVTITTDGAVGDGEEGSTPDSLLIVGLNDGLPIKLGCYDGGGHASLMIAGWKFRMADNLTAEISGYNDLTFRAQSTGNPVIFSDGIAAAYNSSFAGVSIQNHLDLPTYTVATLPVTSQVGRTVFCTNARNAGEGAGAGTGATVVWSGSKWHISGVSTAVTA